MLSIGLPLGAARATDPDAAAWAVAVRANGGTYSGSTLRALSEFAKACKAAGFWSKLTRVNLFCGDQLAAALVPLVATAGNAIDTNANFVAGDYTEALGLTGNGTTKYLNTGLVPLASMVFASSHLAVYNRSSAAGTGFHIGAQTDGTARTALVAPWTDLKAISDLHASAGNGRLATAGAIGTPFGFIIGTRTATDAHCIYRNGLLAASNAVNAGSLTSHAIHVFGANNAGAPSSYSNHTIGGYSIGAGLSASDATAYNTIMETFQDALGRGVQ